MMEIPERKFFRHRQVDNVIPSLPQTIPLPAKTHTVCESGRHGCNALIYQLMTEGRGKVEEGRRSGRQRRMNVGRLGCVKRGRRKRREMTCGRSEGNTKEEEK